MFHKILIANRGEIAVRIIRACRNMGIRSVAVYSKEDQNSLHVQLADQRVCIGEGPARNNYLNMERIITAARNVGADAIHPGFGFLSGNCRFCAVSATNMVSHLSVRLQKSSTVWEINPMPAKTMMGCQSTCRSRHKRTSL